MKSGGERRGSWQRLGIVVLASLLMAPYSWAADPDALVEAFTKALEDGNQREAFSVVDSLSELDEPAEAAGKLLLIGARHRNASPDLLAAILGIGADLSVVERSRGPVEHAAWAGNLTMVKLLVEAGAPIREAREVAERSGFFEIVEYLDQPEIQERRAAQDALYNAVRLQNLEAVKGLVSAGARVTLPSRGGQNAVDLAVRTRSIELLDFLLDVAQQERPGFSPPSLATAVHHSDLDLLRFLIDRGAPVDGAANYQAPLFPAIRKGDLEVVRLLLEKGADPNVRWSGASALAYAENEHRTEIAELLRAAGGELVGRHLLRTPLFEIQDAERAAALIAAGADPNEITMAGESPLMSVLSNLSGCRLDVARVLIEGGADVNYAGRGRGNSPLFLAMNGCHSSPDLEDIVELLLQRGADPNAVGTDGRTALQVARANRNENIADLLLQHGAKEQTSETVDDPLPAAQPGDLLTAAARRGDLVRAQTLLSEGVHVDERNQQGHTALMRAAADGRLEMVEFLLKAGADPNASSNAPGGVHVLTWAASSDNADVMELLIQAGAKIDVRGRNGLSPLGKALFDNGENAFRVLMKHGADVNFQAITYTTSHGMQTMLTPLMATAFSGNPDFVAPLLARGANIDEINGFGDNALMLAIKHSQVDLARALIEADADVNARHEQGSTALFFAARHGLTEVVELLLKAGADPHATAISHPSSGSEYDAASVARAHGHVEIALRLEEAKETTDPLPTSPIGTFLKEPFPGPPQSRKEE